ncbi:baseplate assembly protein [Desulfocurvibacter africanus]|uniref:Baseplate J family protein n=1 Tax=Desulfocurvibacter africanus subsp. africanus str. Walvis Bay TaxID=690850 RepID=F3YY61_DESAF|nr:baseplate J/gp47 family protein [Desulfocurvibacter africanus]EGJ51837.1 Baseplate J family protein [Desulfocurvibacter africanus subsp. africanus str. Walvis Bay]
MNLKTLPAVSFCETDASKVRDAILLAHQEFTGRSLAPGAPERLFLEALAAIVVQQNVLIDLAGKRNLVALADGEYLDHIGVLSDVERLPAVPASVTLRFSRTQSQDFPVAIPAGTRATPDHVLVFETTAPAEIEANKFYVDVTARCWEAGTIGNGYVTGQINRLMDALLDVTAVTNTTESAGGCDEEDDEHFRERVVISPESFSTAGPAEAYVYWAKSASALVSDVSVHSPAPGRVEVRLLLAGGETPGPEILALVTEALTAEKRRPLTDSVEVLAPTPVPFDLEVTYWVNSEDKLALATIQAAVNAAVDEYVAWQVARLGRDLNPSELISRIRAAGAKRVEVASPVHSVLDPQQVARLGVRTVTYGGLEDE